MKTLAIIFALIFFVLSSAAQTNPSNQPIIQESDTSQSQKKSNPENQKENIKNEGKKNKPPDKKKIFKEFLESREKSEVVSNKNASFPCGDYGEAESKKTTAKQKNYV